MFQNGLQVLGVEHHIHPIIAVLNHLNTSKSGHCIRNGERLFVLAPRSLSLCG